jgi:hypothetical protein
VNARCEARKLAQRVGATLEYERKRWHGGGVQTVDIYLAEGTCFDGNDGLDALHHECELDDDIWPGVLDDLRSLQP